MKNRRLMRLKTRRGYLREVPRRRSLAKRPADAAVSGSPGTAGRAEPGWGWHPARPAHRLTDYSADFSDRRIALASLEIIAAERLWLSIAGRSLVSAPSDSSPAINALS